MPAQGAVVVVVDGVADEVAQCGAVPDRVDPPAPDELAHLVLELVDDVHRTPHPSRRVPPHGPSIGERIVPVQGVVDNSFG